MKTIRIDLEYGLYPMWLLNENGYIIDNILAEQLGLDDEITEKVQKLQDLYDSLFINTKIEFSYIGDKEPKKIEEIKKLYLEISNKIKSKLKYRYNVKISELNI
ncbi:hypothetical protein [Sneathia sanguinegens]|uniref:hypothetical protein n=1 Tax=Sneathia sanguinegens TaxID=40543 RepID=UPI000834E25D|nr:hypothetical protein [Sneathia sanguinegens]